VDEDVRVLRCLEDGAGCPRVAGEDDLPPGPRGTENLLGFHRGSARKLDRLAALQASEERSFRYAETLRLLEVEATRARLLDQRVPVRGQAVLHGERFDPIVLARDALSRLQLDEGQLKTVELKTKSNTILVKEKPQYGGKTYETGYTDGGADRLDAQLAAAQEQKKIESYNVEGRKSSAWVALLFPAWIAAIIERV